MTSKSTGQMCKFNYKLSDKPDRLLEAALAPFCGTAGVGYPSVKFPPVGLCARIVVCHSQKQRSGVGDNIPGHFRDHAVTPSSQRLDSCKIIILNKLARFMKAGTSIAESLSVLGRDNHPVRSDRMIVVRPDILLDAVQRTHFYDFIPRQAPQLMPRCTAL